MPSTDAQGIYQQAWDLAQRQPQWPDDLASKFLPLIQEGKFTPQGGVNQEALITFVRSAALNWLEQVDPRRVDERDVPPRVTGAIEALGLNGDYGAAEELVLLLDRKFRIERWGAVRAPQMLSDARDAGYRALIRAAAKRQDYDRVQTYLTRMQNGVPETMLEVAELLARRGEYENAVVSSLLGNASTEWEGAVIEPTSRRYVWIDPGEVLYRIGHIMLERGETVEQVGRVFVRAAKAGLSDQTLPQLLDDLRVHHE